jgi:hypothetical protein
MSQQLVLLREQLIDVLTRLAAAEDELLVANDATTVAHAEAAIARLTVLHKNRLARLQEHQAAEASLLASLPSTDRLMSPPHTPHAVADSRLLVVSPAMSATAMGLPKRSHGLRTPSHAHSHHQNHEGPKHISQNHRHDPDSSGLVFSSALSSSAADVFPLASGASSSAMSPLPSARTARLLPPATPVPPAILSPRSMLSTPRYCYLLIYSRRNSCCHLCFPRNCLFL